jgi:hypothetical protein
MSVPVLQVGNRPNRVRPRKNNDPRPLAIHTDFELNAQLIVRVRRLVVTSQRNCNPVKVAFHGSQADDPGGHVYIRASSLST